MKNLWTPIAAVSVAALGITLAMGCVVKEGPAAMPPPDMGGGGAPHGCAGQPNMNNALGQFREARTWLDKAEHNKGGWRDRAIAATDTAIRETERGCNFSDVR